MLTATHLRVFREQLWRKLHSRRVACPLCGSSGGSLLYKTPNVHMAVFRSIFAERVEICGDCGLVYTNPRLSPEDLERYYTISYQLEGLPVPKSLEEFWGERYKDIWFSKDRDLNLVLRAKPHGRLLDVGCASGTLLWLARQKGFTVTGVEVARGAAEFARNTLGLEVFIGQLEDANFPDRWFDVVTMFHSLEHVPEPRRVLHEVNRVLADDGTLIVVVPNLGSWSAAREGPRWKWLQPHNHYSHFTPDTLARMAALEGFWVTLRSEEGRYGEEEIRAIYESEDVRKIHGELRGSEVILTGRKQNAATSEAAPPARASVGGPVLEPANHSVPDRAECRRVNSKAHPSRGLEFVSFAARGRRTREGWDPWWARRRTWPSGTHQDFEWFDQGCELALG